MPSWSWSEISESSDRNDAGDTGNPTHSWLSKTFSNPNYIYHAGSWLITDWTVRIGLPTLFDNYSTIINLKGIIYASWHFVKAFRVGNDIMWIFEHLTFHLSLFLKVLHDGSGKQFVHLFFPVCSASNSRFLFPLVMIHPSWIYCRYLVLVLLGMMIRW